MGENPRTHLIEEEAAVSTVRKQTDPCFFRRELRELGLRSVRAHPSSHQLTLPWLFGWRLYKKQHCVL